MAEVNNEQLLQFIERIERLEGEIKDIKADEKEIYTEAKSAGFDIKALKQLIKLRSIDPDKLEYEEEILNLYKQALGM